MQLKKLLLLLVYFASSVASAQIATRFPINGGFDDYVISGVYTTAPDLRTAAACGVNWAGSNTNGNGFVATSNRNITPTVSLPGWRSSDGNQVNIPLGISTSGGNFNNCGTIANSSGWTEIFYGGAGGAQSGRYYNHNNPNNKARTHQLVCILPNDTPYYGIALKGRNDVNERMALGIWSTTNVGTLVNSSAAALAGNSVGGGNAWGIDLPVTSTAAWSVYNKTTSPFPGLVSGQMPATWPAGVYGIGMQSSNGSGGGPGNFAGSPVEGAFNDSFFWDVSPLVDLAGFNGLPATQVGVEGGTINLGVRVNGRLRTPVSLVIRMDQSLVNRARPVVDFTLGASNRGTSTLYSTTQTVAFGSGTIQVFPGDIKLDLPVGDYDPNQTTGSIIGFINIPLNLVNDGAVEALETVRYTLGDPAAVTGTDVTDVTGGGDARPDTGLAISKANQSTLCGPANKTAQLNIIDNDKPSLSKAFTQPSVALGGTTTLTFTLLNPADVAPSTDRVTATNINFTDTAPGTGLNGLQFVASSPVTTSSGCIGGTFNTSLTTSFTVTGIGVASSPGPDAVSCQITVQMKNRTGSALNAGCTSATTGPANFLNTSISGTNTASVGGTVTATLAPVTVAACLNVLTAVDISAAKTLMPTTLPLNGTGSFTIVFVNKGPNALPLSGFIDTIPSQLTTSIGRITSSVQGLANTSNFSLSPSTFSGSVTMPSGSTVTIVMGVTATAVTASFTNVVGMQLAAAVADSTPGDTTATAVGAVNLAADLRLTKDDGTTTVTAGGTTSYTLTVSNLGPSSADGAVVTDPVAAGLLCVTNAPCTGTGGANCVNPIPIATLQSPGGYVIPTLPNGGVIKIVVACQVTASGL